MLGKIKNRHRHRCCRIAIASPSLETHRHRWKKNCWLKLKIAIAVDSDGDAIGSPGWESLLCKSVLTHRISPNSNTWFVNISTTRGIIMQKFKMDVMSTNWGILTKRVRVRYYVTCVLLFLNEKICMHTTLIFYK